MMRDFQSKWQWVEPRLHSAKDLMLATSGVAMCLLLGQPLATASSPKQQEISSQIEVLPSNAVRLPPLGSLGTYIPFPEVNPESTAEAKYLVISLSDRQVHLYENEQLKISYPIAIGKEGWETPTGEFNVFQMLEDPGWTNPWTGEVTPPGSDNPLGRRWIGFWTDGTNSIGFHGTPNEELIGQAVSHGCIRMKNDDVVALFEQVDIGITVIVKN